MTDTANRGMIIVGVDGSPSSLHAARWAALEADRRQVPLHLFYACVLPPLGPHISGAMETDVTATLVGQGHRWLREARTEARDAAPDLLVRTDLRVGGAAAELVDESAHALLVVLGSRGLGGFKGALLGSVSSAVAQHGRCPVVVVRGKLPGDVPPDTGPVVVGVDGSVNSDEAVAFAFEEAALRDVPLVAVHTWLDVSVADTWSALPSDVDWEAVAADERRSLSERMAGWSGKYPGVEVRQVIIRDRPVRGLLEQSEDAQLLVVGSRGRSGFSGMGPGSASQALLHHGTCPIAVVRPGTR